MAATDPAAMKAVAGKLTDAESAIALKDLFNRLGAGNLAAEGVEGVSADARSSYLFNSNIVGVEDADLVLLVGSDPRVEAPVLNARLRRACVAGARCCAATRTSADDDGGVVVRARGGGGRVDDGHIIGGVARVGRSFWR